MVIKGGNKIKLFVLVYIVHCVSCGIHQRIFESNVNLTNSDTATNVKLKDYFLINADIGKIVLNIFNELLEYYTGDTNCLSNVNSFEIELNNLDILMTKDTNSINMVIENVELDSCSAKMSELKYIKNNWRDTITFDSAYYRIIFHSILKSKDTLVYEKRFDYFTITFQKNKEKILKQKPLMRCKQ